MALRAHECGDVIHHRQRQRSDFVGKPGTKRAIPWHSISPKLPTSTSIIRSRQAKNSKLNFEYSDPTTNPDGSVNITLSGNLPVGAVPQTAALPVPSPTLFATAALLDSLREAGIAIKSKGSEAAIRDFSSYKRFYTAENQVAEHVSPPLSEEVKITLKVSQNVHAGMGPYLLGLLVAKDFKDPIHAGFKIERGFLIAANLDYRRLAGNGAGGIGRLFSPDFICHYLAYWKTRPILQFLKGLPILGKDGTLAKIQVDNPRRPHITKDKRSVRKTS
jgi:D-alanyl-D-alanine carboxypeptidase/D-alanyl-D-alanine-endopeptidase (penicillin-binding protein 4)